MSVEHLIVFLQTDFWRAYKLCFPEFSRCVFILAPDRQVGNSNLKSSSQGNMVKKQLN